MAKKIPKLGAKLQIAEVGSITGRAMRPKKYKGTVTAVGPNWFKVKYQHPKNGLGRCFSEVVFNADGLSRNNMWSHWDVTKWKL